MLYNYQPKTAAVLIASVSITWDFHLVGHLKKAILRKVTFYKQMKGEGGGRSAAEPMGLFVQP